MKALFVFLPVVLFGAFAHSAPRIPIRCATPTSEKVSREFEGFFNPTTMQVEADATETQSNYDVSFHGRGSAAYTVNNGKIETTIAMTDVRYPTGTIHFSVDANVLTSTAQFEGQIFDQPVVCAIYKIGLLADELALKAFDQVNLPINKNQDGYDQKNWMSSDGKFSIVLNKIPEINGKHGKWPAHTEAGVYLAGNVVSDAKDEPGYMYYLLYRGAGPHTAVEAKLDVAVDVAAMKSMFGSAPVTLNLFHPYGHNVPVKVVVDCTSGSSCLVQASN